MTKVLLTGAAGFRSSLVAHVRLDRGDEVVGADSLNEYCDVRLNHARLAQLTPRAGFTFEQLDVADRVAMPALFARGRFERVIHLAAQARVR
jgi:UDP-glucuronate 4-epimerase